jgi:hypothetical protein
MRKQTMPKWTWTMATMVLITARERKRMKPVVVDLSMKKTRIRLSGSQHSSASDKGRQVNEAVEYEATHHDIVTLCVTKTLITVNRSLIKSLSLGPNSNPNYIHN